MKKSKKIKIVARELEICHMTLSTFIKKLRTREDANIEYIQLRLVFNKQKENNLSEYIFVVWCVMIFLISFVFYKRLINLSQRFLFRDKMIIVLVQRKYWYYLYNLDK